MVEDIHHPQSPQDDEAAAIPAAASGGRSFRILLWVCCGIIDMALVAGLIWWWLAD